MNIDALNIIKNKIENLQDARHSEILDIFNKHNVSYTENSNGSFINLSLITKECYNDLNDYINYINKQENELKEQEDLKEDYKSKYFSANNTL